MFEIGASLREARIKRGLTPADVHKAIRIRDRYLQALEEERWELLPGDAYIKGFLRTYADFLGLDAALYIDEYNSRFARHEETPLAPQPLARAERGAGAGIGLVRPLVAIVVIVAIVAGVAAWQLNRSSKNTQNPPPTTSTTTQGTTKHKKKHHQQPPPAVLPSRAVLVASRGSCWLWVRRGSSTGPTLYEATLAQGQSLPVDLRSGSVWIEVGDPPTLDVKLGGKLVQGLPSQAGATVLLTRHGLKPS